MYTPKINLRKALVLLLTVLMLSALSGAASAAAYSFEKDYGPYTIKCNKDSKQLIVSVDKKQFNAVYGSKKTMNALNTKIISVCQSNNVQIPEKNIKATTTVTNKNLAQWIKINNKKTLAVIYTS